MKSLARKPEMVKYHNDLNKLDLSELTAVQHNIFMSIILEFKDKGNEWTEFTLKDIEKMVKRHYEKYELQKISYDLFQKLFKVDYEVITNTTFTDKIHQINLFDEIIMSLETQIPPKTPEIQKIKYIKSFELHISPAFQYLINCHESYTTHELNEFFSLKRVSAKTIYKNLKQMRYYGIWEIEWCEICRILGFLDANGALNARADYIMSEIKRAVNDIVNLRDLWGNETFKNLKMKPIYKGLDTGKGGKVLDSLCFTFKPDKKPKKTLQNAVHNAKAEFEEVGALVSARIQKN